MFSSDLLIDSYIQHACIQSSRTDNELNASISPQLIKDLNFVHCQYIQNILYYQKSLIFIADYPFFLHKN